MKIRFVLVAALAVAMGAAFAAAPASAKEPGASAGAALTTGLLSPRGMKLGPDGMLYVAEAGTGGDTVATIDGAQSHSGFTGRISKVDPATGARTTVIDKLPSNVGPQGDAVGPADVAFIGLQLYYLQTHGGAVYGFPDNPTGLYRVVGSGTAQLIADIGQFNVDNPVCDVKDGVQHVIEPGGNPYSMMVSDGAFYVVDGNQNQVMRITTGGAITRVTEFPGHPVTTGIARSGGSGPLYVSTLGQFPFTPADGTVNRVGLPSGSRTKVAGGVSSLTDVEFNAGGQLYALQFGDQATDPGAPAPWQFFSGKILKVDTATGAMTPIVTGFMFPTSLIFVGDTAYVSDGGVSIPGLADGKIWQIENFSSVTPPAPEPTAAPTQQAPAPTATPRSGAIAAPDTGNGGFDGAAGNVGGTWIVLALAAAGIALKGAGAAARKRG